MKASIFGLGYVGAVTAACLSKAGHSLIGVDVSESKVQDIKKGISPIIEPGLTELLSEAVKHGRLDATTDYRSAIYGTDVSIVCVGTPSLDSGRLDLSHVRQVCEQLATALKEKQSSHLLLLRSTMLPGSTRTLAEGFFGELIAQGRLEVVYCPEFLREGSAVFDFENPALAVMGSGSGTVVARAEELMGRAIWFEWKGSELIKYACNYWHALKVGFANEVGRICKHAGVDANKVMATLVTDNKLNVSAYYMRPGTPFGGSCLTKDVSALSAFSRQEGINLPLLDNVLATNQAHLDFLVRLVVRTDKRRVLFFGLTFKDNTDDLRGSPMVALAETLIGRGFEVRVFDPNLNLDELQGANRQQIHRRIPHLAALLVNDLAAALRDSEVIVAAHRNVSIEVLEQQVSAQHHVIDVNGWQELRRLPCKVEGLCW